MHEERRIRYVGKKTGGRCFLLGKVMEQWREKQGRVPGRGRVEAGWGRQRESRSNVSYIRSST